MVSIDYMCDAGVPTCWFFYFLWAGTRVGHKGTHC